ncbi:MAG: phosphate ABC transporter ATP-binding protein [Anaerolineae bacterium]
MSTPPETKIAIRQLTFWYGEDLALDGITMDFYAREINVLFGPARGGKTTLLRLLNRLNDLVESTRMEGTISLDGEDLYGPDVDVIQLRRRVGMVFAEPVVLPMSIRQNLLYGPELSGRDDSSRSVEILERTLDQAALWDEVKDRLDDPAASLSGGQQQRLCLARVLALEPDVIVLDEPTSGLDPISTAKVEASLEVLKHDYTVIISPHSVQQAARLADHAAFFLQGRLVEHGSGDQLFTNPVESETEDYVTGRFG